MKILNDRITKKKILILNGSPHKEGNTEYLVNSYIKKISSDVEIIRMDLYDLMIKPCNDCRYCWINEGCFIKDDMKIIWNDSYDYIILASPVYMCNLTPPVISLLSRLNMIWCNENFLKKRKNLKLKKAILILSGGGTGNPHIAIRSAKILFNLLNAKFDENSNIIYSLNTNNICVKNDKNVIKLIDKNLKELI